MKSILIFLAVLSLTLFGCDEVFNDDSQTDFKFKKIESFEELPEEVIFEYDYDGGMWPESYEIYLNKNSGFFAQTDFSGFGNEETLVLFSIENEDFLDFYNFLVDEDFLEIESFREEEVYDRGGDSLKLIIGDKEEDFIVHEVRDSGLDFVEDKYIENFNNILENLDKISVSSLEVENELNFQLNLENLKSLGLENLSCRVLFEDKYLYDCGEFSPESAVEVYFQGDDLSLIVEASFGSLEDENSPDYFENYEFELPINSDLFGKTLELVYENNELKFN